MTTLWKDPNSGALLLDGSALIDFAAIGTTVHGKNEGGLTLTGSRTALIDLNASRSAMEECCCAPEPKWSCVDGVCVGDPEGSYVSESACLAAGCGRASCVGKTETQAGTCTLDMAGEYESIAACKDDGCEEEPPPVQRYNCVGKTVTQAGVCTPDAEGAYETLDACRDSGCEEPPPPTQRYNCVTYCGEPNAKKCEPDAEGSYESLSACENAGCKVEEPEYDDCSLIVPEMFREVCEDWYEEQELIEQCMIDMAEMTRKDCEMVNCQTSCNYQFMLCAIGGGDCDACENTWNQCMFDCLPE